MIVRDASQDHVTQSVTLNGIWSGRGARGVTCVQMLLNTSCEMNCH